MPRVVAVIVTYDAPDVVVGCVRAVMDQTHAPAAVWVIDNAGAVPARDALAAAGIRDTRIEVVRLPENTGPAGGVAEGLRRLLTSDYDAAWVMDDDCVPDPTCLALLLQASANQSQVGVVMPDDYDDNGVVSGWPGWYAVLIPRAVVEAVGVPRDEFFWWIEDTEYLQWRIPRAGLAVHRMPKARVRQTWARRTPTRPAWKYYYEARNLTFYRTRIQGGRYTLRLPGSLARQAGRIVLREDHRAQKFGYFVRGVGDGVLGRLGRRVPVP
jgi:GT2 family glycosyltransferase